MKFSFHCDADRTLTVTYRQKILIYNQKLFLYFTKHSNLVSILKSIDILYNGAFGEFLTQDVDSSAVSNPLINIMKTLDVPLNTTVTALFQDIEKKVGTL